MLVDLVATQSHYRDHLLPIWNNLPNDLLGDVHPLHHMTMQPSRVALVAGALDAEIMRDKGVKAIYVEHGAGQTYSGSLAEAQNPSYSLHGGGRWPNVIGFIAPSQRVADNWTSAPSMAVGCPKMDRHILADYYPTKTVCFAFHWDGAFPETAQTWTHWGPRMGEISHQFRMQGYRVFGHAHPRWNGALDEKMEHQGLIVLHRDEDVFAEAEILFVDNSSLGPEHASLGRPVCWLNGPGYRRDVKHGMRFWEWTKLCPTFDEPVELVHLDLDAVVDASTPSLLAHDAYKYIDGNASARAAMFVADLVRAL